MKKVSFFVAFSLVCMMMLGVASADTTIGQALYAAHGERALCVATVAMDGDVITAALIEEFQFMDPAVTESVPNAAAYTNADGQVMASKRVNDEYYSGNMSEKGGATQALSVSLAAIEEFCVGKTIADLEAAIEGLDKEAVVDVVTSSTLTDTLGYVEAVIAAAKSI